MKTPRLALHWQILIGLLIGAAVGLLFGTTIVGQIPADISPSLRGQAGAELIHDTFLWRLLDLGGDLFLQGLKLIIVPLVTSSIVLAIAGLGKDGGFGRLGLKTLGYYVSTSLANRPGLGQSGSARPIQRTRYSGRARPERLRGRTSRSCRPNRRKVEC
jgi:Na+/H+-dicarboxylate symporter